MKSEKWRMENAGGAPGGTSQTPSGKSHQQPFGKVINRRAEKLSTGAAKSKKKKSPFKNTPKKKKNGKYIFSKYSIRVRTRDAGAGAREERDLAVFAAQIAAREAAQAFGGTDRDLYLWTGAAYALGADTFHEIFLRQRSENLADGMPRDVRRAFQAKLNIILASTFGKGGAR